MIHVCILLFFFPPRSTHEAQHYDSQGYQQQVLGAPHWSSRSKEMTGHVLYISLEYEFFQGISFFFFKVLIVSLCGMFKAL